MFDFTRFPAASVAFRCTEITAAMLADITTGSPFSQSIGDWVYFSFGRFKNPLLASIRLEDVVDDAHRFHRTFGDHIAECELGEHPRAWWRRLVPVPIKHMKIGEYTVAI